MSKKKSSVQNQPQGHRKKAALATKAAKREQRAIQRELRLVARSTGNAADLVVDLAEEALEALR